MREKIKRYDKYDKKPDYHWRSMMDPKSNYKGLVSKSIKPFIDEGTLVDIGCGDGVASFILWAKGFDVFGIEPEMTGLQTAINKISGFKYFNGTIEDYVKMHTDRFDYLYSMCTIEHVPDPTKFVDMMKRVNKFGVIVTDNGPKNGGGTYHNITFTMGTLKELFKDFKTEEVPLGTNKYIGLKIWT